MDPFVVLAVAAGGYLVGAVSMARIVTRVVSPSTKITDKFEVGLEGSDKKLVRDRGARLSKSALRILQCPLQHVEELRVGQLLEPVHPRA